MHFYGLTYGELLRLPMAAFWELSRNVDRIRAGQDRRALTVMANAWGGKPGELAERLDRERGAVVESDAAEEFDRAGFQKLKMLMGG